MQGDNMHGDNMHGDDMRGEETVANAEAQVQVGAGYPIGQLAKAFTTALTHENQDTRRRAEARVTRWNKVLRGMADGTLAIGSRTPVAGLPAWVTPEVVRGGFATGEAAAGGPLLPYEIEAARRAGIVPRRRVLFLYYLTEGGLAELGALLDSGRYEITVPEEGALLVVAWLLRAGDRDTALAILDEIEPFGGELRFTPRPRERAATRDDAEIVHRYSVGDVRQTLGSHRPNRAVAAMNEALAVWNPFADELLAHWLETAEEGRVARREPEGWHERGAALLERYRSLAAEHTLCTKHRKPKENLAILRTALEEKIRGHRALPRRVGMLQHAVDSMVRRRGAPGTSGHTALRERQAQVAARPVHHEVAQVLLARLSELPQDEGVPSTEELTVPVTQDEARRTAVPAGTPVPPGMRATVESALAAPIGTLVERGVVPSAEVLAELAPQLVASTTARAYPDQALRTLMAAIYQAFRNRRSLLLLNLEHQVQLHEIPWVRAVGRHRDRRTDGSTSGARLALTRLGELALQGFPGTILPNPLLSELNTLADAARLRVPIVDELAADIFMGRFSRKFLDAARLAAEILEGTLYARYYGIDYAAIRLMNETDFRTLCVKRAGVRIGDYGQGWVARNGMVIEQSQILTTHNLAVLVHPVGVEPAQSQILTTHNLAVQVHPVGVNPSPGWPDLARRAFATVCVLTGRLHNNPRPLGTVKDAAYAWRQMLFFLALCGLEDQIDVVAWVQAECRRQPEHTVRRLAPALAGLRHVLTGGDLDDGTAPAGARRLLGWSDRRHWMLDHGRPDHEGSA